jgi:putative transposase
VGKKVGPNPTDRAKLGTKRSLLTDGRGLPLGLAVANVIDFKLLEQTLEATLVSRPAPTLTQPQNLCLDKGYDYDGPRQLAYDYGLTAHIRRRGEDRTASPVHPSKPRRWMVERAHSWLNRYRRILVRWEKLAITYEGSLQESDRCVRQTGTDANVVHAASSDGRVLSGRNSPGPGRSAVFQA